MGNAYTQSTIESEGSKF